MRSVFTIFAIFFSLLNYAQNPNTVVAFGKFNIEYGNLDNARIILYEDGKQVELYTPSRAGKFEFVLDLGYKYQFKFEKTGYVSKIVDFDAMVPKSVLESPEFEPFPDFDFHVTLFEIYPNVDTMFFTKPVGKIAYNAELNDFDWDKDYNLEVQRSIEDIEKEIRVKRQEKIDKESETSNKLVTENKTVKETAEKDQNSIPQEPTVQTQTNNPETKLNQNPITNVQPVTSNSEKAVEKSVTFDNKESEPEQVEKIDITVEKPVNVIAISNNPLPTSNQKSENYSISKPNIKVAEQTDISGKTVVQTPIDTKNGTAIFVKVTYSWGGPFYFILEENNRYLNISEGYYNVMVNSAKK